ncbi:MAG: hypothetical protein Pg6A_18980 [Termitinemataceae bacterium]|nr:MAG: hypothetical protein Pg6A_18980 [Termitinemataceae bacterium]
MLCTQSIPPPASLPAKVLALLQGIATSRVSRGLNRKPADRPPEPPHRTCGVATVVPVACAGRGAAFTQADKSVLRFCRRAHAPEVKNALSA